MSDIASRMQSLYQRFGDIPGVFIELHRSLVAVRVDNAVASATVFLQGAQLSHFQPHQQQPVIWCSPTCDYSPGTPLRGGIPLCWPWFGDLNRNPDGVSAKTYIKEASAHGFARNRDWELLDIEQTTDRQQTTLVLGLTLQEGEVPGWPFATTLRLRIQVGSSLQLEFLTHNIGSSTLVYSSALHSYYAVSNIDSVSLDGLDGLEYIDCLRDWTSGHQQGALRIDREVDRIYHNTERDITLIDGGWKRAIHVKSRGSRSAVVWNPWNEKAQRLSQFPDSAYREMMCIETANVDRDCITLQPGESHSLSLEVQTTPLS